MATRKVKDVIKQLKAEGWVLVRQTGSHRQFTHAIHPSVVTVAGKLSDDLKPGTLSSIEKRAGWK